MKIGYIRVSKHEQNEALQRDALKEAGCEKCFSDTVTGVKFERKGLDRVLERGSQNRRVPVQVELFTRSGGLVGPQSSFGI